MHLGRPWEQRLPPWPQRYQSPLGESVLRPTPTALPHAVAPILGWLTNAVPSSWSHFTVITVPVASRQLAGWWIHWGGERNTETSAADLLHRSLRKQQQLHGGPRFHELRRFLSAVGWGFQRSAEHEECVRLQMSSPPCSCKWPSWNSMDQT